MPGQNSTPRAPLIKTRPPVPTISLAVCDGRIVLGAGWIVPGADKKPGCLCRPDSTRCRPLGRVVSDGRQRLLSVRAARDGCQGRRVKGRADSAD